MSTIIPWSINGFELPKNPGITHTASSASDHSPKTAPTNRPQHPHSKRQPKTQQPLPYHPGDLTLHDPPKICGGVEDVSPHTWSSNSGSTSHCLSFIGAWAPDSHHHSSVEGKCLQIEQTTVAAENEIVDSCPPIPRTPPQETAITPEPGFVSDHASEPDTPPDWYSPAKADYLESIALQVFEFWPKGVALYCSHASLSNQAAGPGGQTPTYTESAAGAGEQHQPRDKAQKPLRSGRNESSGRGARLARGSKQNAHAGNIVFEWWCPREAGENNLCCDSNHLTRFDSLLRHLESHSHGPYSGKPLSWHIARLKQLCRHSSNEAGENFSASLFVIMYPGREIPYLTFDRLPDGTRKPHAPPRLCVTAPHLQSTFGLSASPPTVQQDSGNVPLSDPHIPDVPQTVTSSRSHDRHQRLIAARVFVRDMKTDPLLAIRVERIKSWLVGRKERAALERETVKLQVGNKRKDIESDECATGAHADPSPKRKRQVESFTEELNKLNSIDFDLQRSFRDAERQMQELYDAHYDGVDGNGGALEDEGVQKAKTMEITSRTLLNDTQPLQSSSAEVHESSHDAAVPADLDQANWDQFLQYDFDNDSFQHKPY